MKCFGSGASGFVEPKVTEADYTYSKYTFIQLLPAAATIAPQTRHYRRIIALLSPRGRARKRSLVSAHDVTVVTVG